MHSCTKHVQAVRVEQNSYTKEGGGHINLDCHFYCDVFVFCMTKLPLLIWENVHGLGRGVCLCVGGWSCKLCQIWVISRSTFTEHQTDCITLIWHDCVGSLFSDLHKIPEPRFHLEWGRFVCIRLFWLEGPQWRSMSKDVQAWEVFVQ